MIGRLSGSSAPREVTKISLPLKVLAALMRRMPTDVRRADVIWQGLYRRVGGGGFCADAGVDERWPSGLQRPVRGIHHFLMRLNLQNWSDRRTYFSGRYYQPDISRLLEELLLPGDQYVDVGANIGLTSLLARRRIGATGKGVAFEPNPAAFTRLRNHFTLNGITNFDLIPRAVADSESALYLFVPRDEMLLGTFVPERDEGTRVKVQAEPADRYLAAFDPNKPILIKIDVEGFEVQVLRGMQSLLARPNVMVVTEIADAKLRRAGHSREEVHRVLASFGFVAHTIDVRASRWRKALEVSPLSGPLDSREYDALFAKPGSQVFKERVEPVLAQQAPSQREQPVVAREPLRRRGKLHRAG